MSKNTKTARFSRTISSSASRPARKLSLSTRSLAARCDPVAAVLLGPGCLHEQLHRRRDHKQQHGQRFCGEFQKLDRKSTRLNSSHGYISYAVFCLKKKKKLRTSVATHS